MTTVRLELGPGSHDIHVGSGLRRDVGGIVRATTSAQRILVVTQAPVAAAWLADVESSLRGSSLDVAVCEVPDGEAHKDAATLQRVWGACAEHALTRNDAVVALGGGVVTDLAGFAAATFNRGIDVVHVPSTVLAQVDAAIGGKTGIDLPAGKNLVGAIHQPAAVVCDPDLLSTLTPRVRREGFGEIVKHALIADADLLARLEQDPVGWLDPEADLSWLVARNVAIKATVVAADEREHGQRAHLNFGHTHGHVIELLVGLGSWWHGEAVAAGMLVALALGEVLGSHGPDLRARVRSLLGALGLPTCAPQLATARVVEVMRRDKKAIDGVRWIVLDGVGMPRIVTPEWSQVAAAIDMVASPDCAPAAS